MTTQQVSGTSKTASIVAALLIFIGVICEAVAIFGVWWTGDSPSRSLSITLWKLDLTSSSNSFVDSSITWEDYCSPKYLDNPEWCSRTNGVRSCVISAAAFGLFAVISLIIAIAEKKPCWGIVALFCVVISVIMSFVGWGLGLLYPAHLKVDTAGYAFIMAVIGAGMMLAASIFSCCALCSVSSSNFKGFEGDKGGVGGGSSQWGSWKPQPKAPVQQAPRPVPLGLPQMPQSVGFGAPPPPMSNMGSQGYQGQPPQSYQGPPPQTFGHMGSGPQPAFGQGQMAGGQRGSKGDFGI